jgi:hypothetical protein
MNHYLILCICIYIYIKFFKKYNSNIIVQQNRGFNLIIKYNVQIGGIKRANGKYKLRLFVRVPIFLSLSLSLSVFADSARFSGLQGFT